MLGLVHLRAYLRVSDPLLLDGHVYVGKVIHAVLRYRKRIVHMTI